MTKKGRHYISYESAVI